MSTESREDSSMQLPANSATVGEANMFQGDILDESSLPMKIHTFYFIKFPLSEDSNLNCQLHEAEEEVRDGNKMMFQISMALKESELERVKSSSRLRALVTIDEVLHYRMRELKNLAKNLPATDNYRKFMHYIRFINYTRKDEIHELLLKGDLDGIRKKKHGLKAKIKHLEEELKAIDKKVSSAKHLEVELDNKCGEAFERRTELRKQHKDMNAYYYKNLSTLKTAKYLATKKDKKGLTELSCSEVEKFMCKWNNSAALRDDYARRVSTSLEFEKLIGDSHTESEALPKSRTRQPNQDCKAHQPYQVNKVSNRIAKANVAVDRKKGLAEKAKKKAAVQAENTITECRKRAKDKATVDPVEVDMKVVKPEKLVLKSRRNPVSKNTVKYKRRPKSLLSRWPLVVLVALPIVVIVAHEYYCFIENKGIIK